MNNKFFLYKKITSKIVFTFVSISMLFITFVYSYDFNKEVNDNEVNIDDNGENEIDISNEDEIIDNNKLEIPSLNYLKDSFDPYTDNISKNEFINLYTNYLLDNNEGEYGIDFIFSNEDIINVKISDKNEGYYETHSYKYFV